MHALWLLPPALSLAVLAAHFWRAGAWPLVVACAALVALLALPRPWVARLTQIALLAGALEWLLTALALVRHRLVYDQPWARLALILGAVALLTAASAWVFRRAALRSRYGLR